MQGPHAKLTASQRPGLVSPCKRKVAADRPRSVHRVLAVASYQRCVLSPCRSISLRSAPEEALAIAHAGVLSMYEPPPPVPTPLVSTPTVHCPARVTAFRTVGAPVATGSRFQKSTKPVQASQHRQLLESLLVTDRCAQAGRSRYPCLLTHSSVQDTVMHDGAFHSRRPRPPAPTSRCGGLRNRLPEQHP